ncbi:hypothetical protein D3C71_552980 [compost metagenome]
MFRPAASGEMTCSDHWPSSPTTASPSAWVPVLSLTITVTVWPGWPVLVPVSSGRVSSVVLPAATLPVMPPAVSRTPVMASLLALGGVTSISKLNGPEGSLSSPAGSRATMVMTWWPSFMSVDGVKAHWPSSSTTVWPISTPLFLMRMVSPGVPWPWNSG